MLDEEEGVGEGVLAGDRNGEESSCGSGDLSHAEDRSLAVGDTVGAPVARKKNAGLRGADAGRRSSGTQRDEDAGRGTSVGLACSARTGLFTNDLCSGNGSLSSVRSMQELMRRRWVMEQAAGAG